MSTWVHIKTFIIHNTDIIVHSHNASTNTNKRITDFTTELKIKETRVVGYNCLYFNL